MSINIYSVQTQNRTGQLQLEATLKEYLFQMGEMKNDYRLVLVCIPTPTQGIKNLI